MTTRHTVKRRPGLRLIALSITLSAALGLASAACWAQAPAVVSLSANPSVILADGQSTTIITAQVGSSSGHAVPDGTLVRFSTISGTLSATSVAVSGGVARVTLTSSPLAGTAVVTATFLGDGGGASGQLKVEFTDDKDLANSDRSDENWIEVSSKEYLQYSADDQIVDAAAPKHGTHMSYEGLTIDADALQVDVQNQQVRARNAIVRRKGVELLDAALLCYNLPDHSGNAIITNTPGQRTVGNVTLSGPELQAKPLDSKAISSLPATTFGFADISASRVLVVASEVAVKPNDRIQLKHASIFVDGKKIVSMPYQVMPLSTNQIFGQQVLGYGTDGFILNVPYYFAVSPKSTGTLYLRSEAGAEENGTFYNGRNGLALDLDENYGQSDGPSHGDFQLMGMGLGNWGASWTHSQTFDRSTRGYFYLNSPEHSGLLASGDLTHQFQHFSFNFNASDSRQPSENGYSSDTRTVSANLQTDPLRLFGTRKLGLNAVGLVTAQDAQSHINLPIGSTSSTVDTHGLGVRLFTPTVFFDRKTTLTDSLNVEQDYGAEGRSSALTVQANMAATKRIGPTTSASFTYAFVHNPFLAQPHVADLPNNTALLLLNPVDRHDFNLSLFTGPPSGLWNFSLMTTYELPTQSQSLSTVFNYRILPGWHAGFNETFNKVDYFTFQDFELQLSRNIGSRDLVLSWSTLDHRFRFNVAAAQF